MKILDACCGGKMFWYEKDLDFVTFQDVRAGVKEYSGTKTTLCGNRRIKRFG